MLYILLYSARITFFAELLNLLTHMHKLTNQYEILQVTETQVYHDTKYERLSCLIVTDHKLRRYKMGNDETKEK